MQPNKGMMTQERLFSMMMGIEKDVGRIIACQLRQRTFLDSDVIPVRENTRSEYCHVNQSDLFGLLPCTSESAIYLHLCCIVCLCVFIVISLSIRWLLCHPLTEHRRSQNCDPFVPFLCMICGEYVHLLHRNNHSKRPLSLSLETASPCSQVVVPLCSCGDFSFHDANLTDSSNRHADRRYSLNSMKESRGKCRARSAIYRLNCACM